MKLESGGGNEGDRAGVLLHMTTIFVAWVVAFSLYPAIGPAPTKPSTSGLMEEAKWQPFNGYKNSEP